MEFAEVWHFLDASVGNTVIVPSEIVAKAGSDFDVDKIFFMFPHITSDGALVSAPAESLDELKALVEKANKATKKQRQQKGFRGAQSLINQYKAYSQNQLIKSTKEILSLPDNFASLTKPNNTYLIEDEVEFYDEYATGYNSKINEHGEPVRRDFKDEKDVNSPSRSLDYDYNLNKFEEMLSGNLPLGILAKKNKTHTLFKSLGALMPASYKATIWNDTTKKYDELDAAYDVVMPIKHQTTTNKKGEEVVSLSNENNVDGEKIGDILSHGLQGILDRANNPFPFKLKIIKEALPIMNHLIEAGGSVPEVFAFINNPWISDYINNQILLSGSTALLLTENVQSTQVRSTAARMTIQKMVEMGGDDYVKQLSSYANDRRLQDLVDQLRKDDPNKKYVFELIVDGEISNLAQASGERIFNSKDFPLDQLYSLYEYTPGSVNQEKLLFKRSAGIANNDNFYYAGQAAWTRAFGDENAQLTEKQLKDLIKDGLNPNIAGLAMLMRMIQLEKQFSGMDALEMAFSPDTGLMDTTLQVKRRDDALAILSEVSKVDSDFLDRLRNNSILSSFYKSDMILKLTEPLFALRLNKEISDYLNRTITQNKEAISQRYGAGISGQENFTNAFNNAVVNYIYQNTMSNFPDANGQPVLLPESIHSLPIEKVESGPAVTLTDKGFKVNINKAEQDYINNVFLANNNTTEGYVSRNEEAFMPSENPFPTFASYLKFAVEKAYLRDVYKEETESFITQRALLNTFNRAYIMGTTKYSYTDLVMNTISEFEGQNIKINYPVLSQLSPARFEKDVNVLELNDKGTAKGEVGLAYFKNLKQLGDPSIRKVRSSDKAKEKADNKKISDVFKNFSSPSDYAEPVVTDQEILDDILGDNEFFQQNFGTGSVKPSTSDNEVIYYQFEANKPYQEIGNINRLTPLTKDVFERFKNNFNTNNYDEFMVKIKEIQAKDSSDDIQMGPGFPTIDEVSQDNGKTWKLSMLRGKEFLDNYYQIRIDKGWAKKITFNELTQPSTQNQLNNQRNIVGTLRVDLGGFSIDNVSEEAYNNLLHATADPFYKGLREWISKFKKTLKPFAVVDSSEIIEKYTKELATQPSTSIKPRIDTSREWRGDLEARPVYTSEGVNTMRTSKSEPNENFGNPFSESGVNGTVNLGSILKAAKAYKNWLLDDATTNDYGIDPKEFVKYIIKSAGGKPTSKGMFAIDGQHYYIPNLNIERKSYGYDAFIKVLDDELYLGASTKGYTDFKSEEYYQLGDLNFEQRNWILDQINQGKLDGATLLYAGKLAARNEGMHPISLAEVVEELRPAQPTVQNEEVSNGVEVQPGLEVYKDALTEQEQKEFYEFGKSILEKHGYNPFPQYVMASAGQFEWSPELVADRTGKAFNRGANYNKNIISQKAIVKGSDGSGRWGYRYYTTNLDGSKIEPIPQNIINILQKVTGQDMSDYDTVLINLYPSGRTLGWHTDVTEDHRALDRDIVSVSIGANADFTFANTPKDWISGDPSNSYKLGKINLSSGDIVQFGGPSRLISHTVTNVNGKTDLGPINLSNSNVNSGFKGGLLLNDDWRLNFTFRVADVNNSKGKRSVSQENMKSDMNSSTEAISDFYNGLTEEQKNKLGNLDALIEEYEDIPFDQAVEDYIETLKCKL